MGTGIKLATGLLLAIAVTQASSARERSRVATDSPPPKALADLMLCRAEPDDAKRLACFDRSSRSLAAATEAREVVVVDQQQIQAARRSLFGFTVPKLPILGFGGKDDQPAELTAMVKSAHQDRQGQWVLELVDGAVWHQLDDHQLFKSPHAGSTVVIKPAMGGTFFIRCDNQMGFRASRQS